MDSTTTVDTTPYTTDAFAASVGATYRIVDYWARTDVLRPSGRDANGSGSRRSYTAGDVRVGRVIAGLARMGVGTDTLRVVVSALRDLHTRGQWEGVVFLGSDGELADAPAAVGWFVDLDVLGT